MSAKGLWALLFLLGHNSINQSLFSSPPPYIPTPVTPMSPLLIGVTALTSLLILLLISSCIYFLKHHLRRRRDKELHRKPQQQRRKPTDAAHRSVEALTASSSPSFLTFEPLLAADGTGEGMHGSNAILSLSRWLQRNCNLFPNRIMIKSRVESSPI